MFFVIRLPNNDSDFEIFFSIYVVTLLLFPMGFVIEAFLFNFLDYITFWLFSASSSCVFRGYILREMQRHKLQV